MDLQFRHADGRPLAGATVAVAEAPVAVPDIAWITDAAGGAGWVPPAPGRYVLAVWHPEGTARLGCEIGPGDPGPGALVLTVDF